MKTAIIGAGAAGCFAAIELKRRCPEAEVTVYEAARKPLAKVAITGGGRCNLTNTFASVRSLAAAYPRGERLMKRLLKEFGHEEAWQWFEREGVRLTAQADGCVFPTSQDAMEIVSLLTRLMSESGVRTRTSCRAVSIKRDGCSGSGGRQERREIGSSPQAWEKRARPRPACTAAIFPGHVVWGQACPFPGPAVAMLERNGARRGWLW